MSLMLSTEAELGAVQSKATRLADFARFRLGSERTPRSKRYSLSQGRFGFVSVFLEPNFKALNPTALPCSGRYAGATDQRPDDALRLQWPSCARLQGCASLWPGWPSAFAPVDSAIGNAPCARRTRPERPGLVGYLAWSHFRARACCRCCVPRDKARCKN